MSIQQGLTLSFKQDMLQAGQDLLTDTLKMALYNALSDIGPSTTEYSAVNEISGNGYTSGGNLVTGASLGVDPSNNTVYVNFGNVEWPGANFIARGALIYNVTRGNKSVAVLDFGADKQFSPASNTVTMPVNSSSTALIRFP